MSQLKMFQVCIWIHLIIYFFGGYFFSVYNDAFTWIHLYLIVVKLTSKVQFCNLSTKIKR